LRLTRLIMGMPIAVEIVNAPDTRFHEQVFAWFDAVDRRFSPFREDSEVSRINRGEIAQSAYSAEMTEVLALSEDVRRRTGGYFNVRRPDGKLDPSGMVKGWAIGRAAAMLAAAGTSNFFVDAGGDIHSSGVNAEGLDWSVGIRNPFDERTIVKVVYPRGRSVATSGNYVRGSHVYDPLTGAGANADFVSLTVIGPDIVTADAFATAAFAMGRPGIGFIEETPGLEGYMIDRTGKATMTGGFADYTVR
jgi:thiamine biosynthesis lipoprotein